MKNKSRNSRVLSVPFQSGQVWQLADSHLQIGLVGRTLVHYKHFKGLAKRPPILLSGKDALEKFLQEHRAVLLPDPVRLPPEQPPARACRS
jgi:hypothetical protein